MSVFLKRTPPSSLLLQVSALALSLLEPARFLKLPERPKLREAFGAELSLLPQRRGVLAALPSLAALQQLKSYSSAALRLTPGDEIAPVQVGTGNSSSSSARESTACPPSHWLFSIFLSFNIQ